MNEINTIKQHSDREENQPYGNPTEIQPAPITDTLFISGTWSVRTSWEFFFSNIEPDPKISTVVFVLPINKNGKFALTRGKRGWEIPGGHIEERETVRGAMLRECLEESGVTLEKYVYLGYQKTVNGKKTVNPSGGFYPFPYGCIPYYVGVFSAPQVPIADDGVTVQTGLFSQAEIIALEPENRGLSLLCKIFKQKHFTQSVKLLRK